VEAPSSAFTFSQANCDTGTPIQARAELRRFLGAAGKVTPLWVGLLAHRVQINHSAKPNYLHGRAGTVTGWAGQNVVVQLDQPVGRFTTGELRCPPLVLEPLAPE
jgi:hypothetical protein